MSAYTIKEGLTEELGGGAGSLVNFNAANTFIQPVILGTVSSTVNGAIWLSLESSTFTNNDVVVLGTTSSTLNGALYFSN